MRDEGFSLIVQKLTRTSDILIKRVCILDAVYNVQSIISISLLYGKYATYTNKGSSLL